MPDTTLTPLHRLTVSDTRHPYHSRGGISTIILEMTKLLCKEKKQRAQRQSCVNGRSQHLSPRTLAPESECPIITAPPNLDLGVHQEEEELGSCHHGRKSVSPTSVPYPWFLNSWPRVWHIVGTKLFAE